MNSRLLPTTLYHLTMTAILLALTACAGSPPRREPPERVGGMRLLREGIDRLSRGERETGEELLMMAQQHFDSIGDRDGGGMVRVNRARLARQNGDREGARRLLDDVERFQPTDPQTIDQMMLERGLLALGGEGYGEALTIGRTLMTRDDPLTTLIGAQIAARALRGEGKEGEAAGLLDRVISRTPAGAEGEAGRVRLLRARIALDQGDDRRAAETLREAIDLFRRAGDGPFLHDSLLLYAGVMERLGDPAAAELASEEGKRIERAMFPSLPTAD
ncbi:MAG: hypothetical protein Fur0034_09570 [Desulfuromonadia bacterium]